MWSGGLFRTVNSQSLHNCHPQVCRYLHTEAQQPVPASPFPRVTAEQSLPKPEAKVPEQPESCQSQGCLQEGVRMKEVGVGGPGFSSVPVIAQEAWDSCKRMGAKARGKG